MSPPEPPPRPPWDFEAFLDSLDDEAAAEEIGRVYSLTPEAREAELRAMGLDPERAHAIAREVIALSELLHADGSLERLSKLSAEEMRAEITKAGLDPQKVGDRVQAALAERRSSSMR